MASIRVMVADDHAVLRAGLRLLINTQPDMTVVAEAGTFYLVKKAADTELLNAIRAVYQGRTFVDVPLGHVPQPSRQDPKLLECLSEREREVFDLVAHGHTSQAIADRIFLSVKTVETYRRRIMEKLRLRNRADLIHLAIEQGILGTARE